RNTAGIGKVLCNTHRPGIGIGDSHGCKRGTATDKGKGDLRPYGALWEIEALTLPPSDIQSDDNCGTGNNGHHPAPERSDRPRWPSAHELEGRIHGGNSAASSHPPGSSAPDKITAQGHDEGGHAQIGDDRTLQGADADTDNQA